MARVGVRVEAMAAVETEVAMVAVETEVVRVEVKVGRRRWWRGGWRRGWG